MPKRTARNRGNKKNKELNTEVQVKPKDIIINITNDLIVDDDTLFIDGINNKVGICTINPMKELDVNGTVLIRDTLTVFNETHIDNLMIDGELSVTDKFTVGSVMSIDANLNTINITGVLKADILDISESLIVHDNLLSMGTFKANGDVIVGDNTLVVDVKTNMIGINKQPKCELDISGSMNISDDMHVKNLYVSEHSHTVNETIMGKLTVANTMYVDSDTNKIGINTTNPEYDLDINNTLSVSDTLYCNNIDSKQNIMTIGSHKTKIINIGLSSTETINIGANADTINIGGIGCDINFNGNVNYVTKSDTIVTDHNIIINYDETNTQTTPGIFFRNNNNDFDSYIKLNEKKDHFIFKANNHELHTPILEHDSILVPQDVSGNIKVNNIKVNQSLLLNNTIISTDNTDKQYSCMIPILTKDSSFVLTTGNQEIQDIKTFEHVKITGDFLLNNTKIVSSISNPNSITIPDLTDIKETEFVLTHGEQTIYDHKIFNNLVTFNDIKTANIIPNKPNIYDIGSVNTSYRNIYADKFISNINGDKIILKQHKIGIDDNDIYINSPKDTSQIFKIDGKNILEITNSGIITNHIYSNSDKLSISTSNILDLNSSIIIEPIEMSKTIFTNNITYFTIPNNLDIIKFKIWGAGGSGGKSNIFGGIGGSGGTGSFVSCKLLNNVHYTAGDILLISVGQNNNNNALCSGEYNGGAGSLIYLFNSKTNTYKLLAVAGGGGGGGAGAGLSIDGGSGGSGGLKGSAGGGPQGFCSGGGGSGYDGHGGSGGIAGHRGIVGNVGKNFDTNAVTKVDSYKYILQDNLFNHGGGGGGYGNGGNGGIAKSIGGGGGGGGGGNYLNEIFPIDTDNTISLTNQEQDSDYNNYGKGGLSDQLGHSGAIIMYYKYTDIPNKSTQVKILSEHTYCHNLEIQDGIIITSDKPNSHNLGRVYAKQEHTNNIICNGNSGIIETKQLLFTEKQIILTIHNECVSENSIVITQIVYNSTKTNILVRSNDVRNGTFDIILLNLEQDMNQFVKLRINFMIC